MSKHLFTKVQIDQLQNSVDNIATICAQVKDSATNFSEEILIKQLNNIVINLQLVIKDGSYPTRTKNPSRG